VLEEGSRKFYSEIPALVADEEAKKLFLQLTVAEEHHKASLVDLYKAFSGSEPGSGFPGRLSRSILLKMSWKADAGGRGARMVKVKALSIFELGCRP